MIPELHTERLILRGFKKQDFPVYADFITDEKMTRYIASAENLIDAWGHFCTLVGEWHLLGMGTFAIEVRASGECAGYAGLWCSPGLEEPELCWGLFEGHHGKGYATEAAVRVQVWSEQELGLPALMSFVHPNNIASRKVAERLGATNTHDTELRGEPRHFMRHVLPSTKTTEPIAI